MRTPAALLLCSLVSQAWADDFAIPPYEAHYSVAWGGLHVGDMEVTLSRQPDGSYQYKSITDPAGLASLFASDVVTEISEFELTGEGPRSLHYIYSQTGGKHEKSEDIRFEWSKGEAEFQEDDHKKTLALSAGVYDRFLAQLLLSSCGSDGKLPSEIRVADHREMVSYVTKSLDKASVRTGNASFQDVSVVEIKQAKKDDVTRLYLAPAVHYLPVEIELLRPERSTVTIVLESITFSPTKAPAAASRVGERQPVS